ncbi:lipopolysaccharide biosynthesis protein [Planctomycetota bacterium]
MSDGLKTKALHGLFWAFFERAGEQGIQFIISIILARLLFPEQFGLIGMLVIFMMIAETFLNSGFGPALIQKKDATHIDECSIFYFNILVGFLAAGLLCVAAPWIADFYNQPLLTPLTRALSLNLIINAFGLIQITLLTKHIDFKTQLKVSVIAAVLSGTIGITMAFNGFGIWSLVAYSLSSNLFRTTLLWLSTTWRPSLVFSLKALRDMFGFGSRLLIAGLVRTIFDNLYLVVIGKLFSAGDLGYYARAKRLEGVPRTNLSGVVNKVTFPVLSTIQDEPVRLKRALRKALTTLALFNFPMMIGLALIARPLVIVLLTEKWLPCVPYLRLLCITGLLYPLHAVNLNLLLAKGRSDLSLRLTVIKNAAKVVVLVITCRFGIEAILWGQIALSVCAYWLNAYYTKKLVGYGVAEQLCDVAPYLGGAVMMGACVYAAQFAVPANVMLQLTLQVLSGVVLFTVLSWALRLPAFLESWEMIRLTLLHHLVSHN